MHGHEICASLGDACSGTLHLMRDIVELEIQKDLEAELVEVTDDSGAASLVERHANLYPTGVSGKFIA